MKLKDILSEGCIECAVPLSSKKRVLEYISQLAAKKYANINQHTLLDSLTDREKMGSTGIGNGIAMPHGRLVGIEQPIAILITSAQAIPFDAIDNQAVDIFIAFFVPDHACNEYLGTLQETARLFSNNKITKKIRQCTTADQIHSLLFTNN